MPMKKLSKRTLPIRVQVYAGLMLLCTVILMIYAFTAVHIYYFSGNVASLTDNYYGHQQFSFHLHGGGCRFEKSGGKFG